MSALSKTFAGLLLLFSLSQLEAQQALSLSIFNESTTVPYTTLLNTPIHPGFQAGLDFNGKTNKHFRFYPSINVGYLFHNKLFQGWYINGEMSIDYRTNFGLDLKSKLGIGYLHTFTTQQEFQLKNGRYVSESDRGNSRIMPSLSLGLGYRLKKDTPSSTELFMLYQSWIEYPYSPGFIPLMSHTNLHLGTKFYFDK